MKKLLPGEAYDLSADVVDARTRHEKGRAGNQVALIFSGGAVGFLAGAAILGIIKGSYGELNDVWDVVGPLAGMVFGYYFAERKTHDPP